jgi:hypothetical protein
MRVLMLFLVLLNVGFFAWSKFIAPVESGADPQPLTRQLEPDRLRIVPTAPTASNVPDVAPGTSTPATAVATPAPAPPAPRPTRIACLEWGSFTLADAPAAARVVGSLGLTDRLTQRRTEETAGWWVFIPPQRDQRQGAQRKARELRALGVKDYFIVQEEGPNRWAISLGVFRTEARARARLEALEQKKVRSAEVGPRETRVPKLWLQLRDVEPSTKDQLETIVSRIPGTELRVCDPD